jgi:hypothetical protein
MHSLMLLPTTDQKLILMLFFIRQQRILESVAAAWCDAVAAPREWLVELVLCPCLFHLYSYTLLLERSKIQYTAVMTMQITLEKNLEAAIQKLALQQGLTAEEVVLEAIRKEIAPKAWSFYGAGDSSIDDLSLRDEELLFSEG